MPLLKMEEIVGREKHHEHARPTNEKKNRAG